MRNTHFFHNHPAPSDDRMVARWSTSKRKMKEKTFVPIDGKGTKLFYCWV
jgi:hypothetical protein